VNIRQENAARGWEKIVRERDRTWILSRSGVPPGGLKDTARWRRGNQRLEGTLECVWFGL